MTDILRENETQMREAGLVLIAIGLQLTGGKYDEALADLEELTAVRQKYRPWEDLERARAKIESVIRERGSMETLQQVAAEMIGVVLGAALRSRLG